MDEGAIQSHGLQHIDMHVKVRLNVSHDVTVTACAKQSLFSSALRLEIIIGRFMIEINDF